MFLTIIQYLLKCIRNNFLNVQNLRFLPPQNNDQPLVAKWSDLKELFETETAASDSLRASRLTKLAINPPLIARQRVDVTQATT